MKKRIALVMAAMMAAGSMGMACFADETEAPAAAAETEADVSEEAGSVDFAEVFPSWNPDSASLNELVAFVSDCTDESSEGYQRRSCRNGFRRHDSRRIPFLCE